MGIIRANDGHSLSSELFYVDMSRYNTSWRHEIRKHHHLNYCGQPWRSIRRQEISKHDPLNYCDKPWRSIRPQDISKHDHFNYCDQPWRSIRQHGICKHDHLNYCDWPWRSIRWQEISKHDHLSYCDYISQIEWYRWANGVFWLATPLAERWQTTLAQCKFARWAIVGSACWRNVVPT